MLIATIEYNSIGHSQIFKKLCVELDGHMNSTLAGDEFKDAATSNFCDNNNKKYRYTCKCGIIMETKRLIKTNSKKYMYGYCKICNFPLSNWKISKITNKSKGWNLSKS